MTVFTKTAVDIFAAQDASGAARKVSNHDVQVWGTEVERALAAFQAGGGVIFETKAQADTNLSYDANTMAWVLGDPVASNNGVYQKQGASGSGSWQRVGDLPYSFILATNTNSGDPNAIEATTVIPIPAADGGALIALPIVADNTASPVTVSFNGGPALTIKSIAGNDVLASALADGMTVWGFKSGDEFRLVTDLSSAGILAGAEAAAEAAENAASRAQSYSAMLSADKIKFATVADLLADETMSYTPGEGLIEVGPGDIIEAQGFRYEVVSSDTTGTGLVETAGGVLLYVGEGDVNVVQFGTVGDGITDDAPAINAFFQHISNVACRSGRFEGTFAIGSQIVMGRDTTSAASDSLTKALYVNATIITIYTDVEGAAVHNNGWRFESINGHLHIICGGVSLESRRQRHGMIIQGNGRGKIDTVWVEGAIREGVVLFGDTVTSQGNNNLFHARLIRTLSCGHNQAEVISSFSNTGSAGSFAQRTVIQPSAIPDYAEVGDFIKHGNYQYAITDIDRGAGTVTVFPWLVSPSISDQIIFQMGAGVLMWGGDNSINKFDFIDVTHAPIGLKQRSLYPPVIDTLHYSVGSPAGGSHGFGLAMIPRNIIDGAFEGGVIQNLYCEAGGDYDVVATTLAQTSFVIGSNTSSNAGANAFLQLGPNLGNGKWGTELFKAVVLNQDSKTLTRGASRPQNTTASTVQCSIAPTAIAHYTARSNSPTFQLQYDEALNRNFGYDTIICMAWGTGANGAPTGTVTFTASGGATVMGGASKTYSGLTGATMWQCHYDYATNDWIVSQVTG